MNERTNEKRVLVKLGQHNYNLHQGKAWIAMIDPDTKKILKFVNPENSENKGNVIEKFFWMNTADKNIYRFSGRGFRFDGTVEQFLNDKRDFIVKIEDLEGNDERKQAIQTIKDLMTKFNITIEEVTQ
jgi:hypothetical protein